MGDFKNLSAIVDTTRDRHSPLGIEIRGGEADLWLAVTMQTGPRGIAANTKTLVSVPFDPEDPDAAARDAAKRLTLDGQLPRGMGT